MGAAAWAMNWSVVCFLVLLTGCLCLKDVKISVPAAVIRDRDAVLQCNYDLEGDQLYSVKWYRRGREFYRYTPNERPPIKQFKITGLYVNEKSSNSTHVLLEKVPLEISGLFSCEVTADEPSFFTDMKTSFMQVVELPIEDPQIHGLQTRYRLGDTLKANCTSEMSNPSTNLTWYVNGLPVDASRVHKYRPRPSADGRYFTSDSVLRLQITKHLFSKGRLKIRCVASLYDVYYRSSEKSVELEKKRHKIAYVQVVTLTTSSSTEQPHWKLAQAAEKHPGATLVFHSQNDNGAISRMQLQLSHIILVTLLILSLLR